MEAFRAGTPHVNLASLTDMACLPDSCWLGPLTGVSISLTASAGSEVMYRAAMAPLPSTALHRTALHRTALHSTALRPPSEERQYGPSLAPGRWRRA